ncbi:hypothetical protein K445DRAFT_302510 [Daldinia sp. EC12]|nr:hypothetical protein K445DRAFT_302510 [Daldinia sp. EC12]
MLKPSSYQNFMASFGKLPLDAWRRTGLINIALASACEILLLVCLVISLKSPGSSIGTSTIVFKGPCHESSRINTLLHLLLNLLSTGILASSNYFMQIVSSPSRDEVDKAHMLYYSLDIGIPSTKNIPFISCFKKSCWVILLLSSLPIHLFFNSTIFETTYLGSDWQTTIATEAFLRGANYFAPGASLDSPDLPGYEGDTSYSTDWTPIISLETKKAATIGRNWTHLDPLTCYTQYSACEPKTQYRDVVVVIDSGTNRKEGWVREEVFNLTKDLSLWWDTYVPRNETNSMWYSTPCGTKRVEYSIAKRCDSSCWRLFPGEQADSYGIRETSPSNWELFWTSTSNQFSIPRNVTPTYDLNENFTHMTVKYCLAEPYPRVCKVGISNILLTLVISCTFIKIIQCSIIVWRLPRQSLVTPGDAIASFIMKPDPYTVGLGTLDVIDICRLESKQRYSLSSYDEHTLDATIKSRRWSTVKRRYLSIIPQVVRLRTHALLALSTVILSACLALSYQSNGHTFGGPFGYSDEIRATDIMDGSGYLATLIVANAPQLLLSACYFSYNSFLTRLLVEQEWNSYSLKYKPLRVSYPQGEQISSYRLQLSYKYSIPLIVIMIICHWLLSNALFFFGIEGGFWGTSYHAANTQAYFHLSENSLISLGYSTPAILALLIVSCTIIPLPLLLSLRKPKGSMVAGGSNSLVMSAACHCFISSPTEVEIQPHSPLNNEEEGLKKLSQSKLKWGATSLASDLAKVISEESGNPVMHLGFGGESSNVRYPEEGGFYV